MKKPMMPGTVLQGFLDEYHLSIPQVAEAVGLSQSALRQVLTNKAKLTLNAAARFAKYFNTTIAYWLELQQACELAELKKDAEFTAALKNIPKAKKPKPAQAAKPGKSGAVKKSPAKPAGQKPRTTTAAPKERRSLKPSKGTGNDEGILNTAGIENRVLYIGKGNTLGENLTLSGGNSGGAVLNEGTLEDACHEDRYEREEDDAVETARQRIQAVLNGEWLLTGLDLSKLGLTDAMLEKALSHFSSCQLEAVTGPRGVDKVYLSENPITKVPAFIGSPTVFMLVLDNTRITEVPEWIGNMTTLGELSVTGTPITELPESMSNLTSLRKLYIGETKLQTVPEWIGKLTRLDDLSLRDLNITEVPAFIENLTLLTRLNLDGTEISAESVPEYLIARVKAGELELDGFYITKDPGEE
jgi:addiction module HigA family antidote